MIIDDLVRGSIDMHCHHAPDALIEGRMDALETVKRARDMGMRAVVLKNTYFPTAPLANIIEQLVPEVKVFGSVCLDYEIGGLISMRWNRWLSSEPKWFGCPLIPRRIAGPE